MDWTRVEDQLPPMLPEVSTRECDEHRMYFVTSCYGKVECIYWCNGWNCMRKPDGEIDRENELTNFVVAWLPIPEPYIEPEVILEEMD